MQHTSRLIADNVHALRQGIDLIRAIDDETYSTPNAPLTKAGIGSHFRHCIDFYSRFAAGLPAGRINYDLRERNAAIETSRLSAIEKIEAIIERLRSLAPQEGEREVEVISESSDNDADWSRSSIKRELQFLLSHTIHHYAIVAVSLRMRGIEPGEEFGVALSTLRHWKEQSASVLIA
ncbi:MAG: DinB family protein [Acidobacteriota bacterium]